jgi:hypothetical protein
MPTFLSTTFELVERLEQLNSRLDDINHAEKLDLFRSLCETFKRKDPVLDNKDKLVELTSCLATELNKCTSKDVVRKLIIKCIISLTKLDTFRNQIQHEVLKNLAQRTIGKFKLTFQFIRLSV